MKKYQLKNIDCASCAAKIEDGLSKMPEVKFVSVNFANSTLQIDAPDIEEVKQKIKEIEPEVEVVEPTESALGGTPSIKKLGIKDELVENKKELIKIFATLLLLAAGLIFEEEIHNTPYHIAEYLVFIPAYLISGWIVLKGALRSLTKGKVFNEHFLMTIATLGAIAIDAMPEAVTVMLFYVIGELFQDIAVNRSRKSVKALLEIRPDYANIKINGEVKRVSPIEVHPGQIIVVKPGEKIPLDGIIKEGNSFVDTSALTGESVPKAVKESETVLAGMLNKSGMLTIEVTKEFGESSISKILELVENATAKKAQTEKFITTFARYYTPVVVFSALLLAVIPPLFFAGQTFTDWIYRALVVLVISCPCALVISIPLGYFGGIGGASRRGILVKGSNYLDALTKIKTVVFDKTGTLTKGEFKVAEIISANGFKDEEILKYAAYAEANSSHPIAKSILDAYGNKIPQSEISEVKEISGHGIKAKVNADEIMVGNDKLLHLENIEHDKCDIAGTVVHVTINRKYAGYIVISDSLKDDAAETISALHKLKINTVMLTGDNKSAAEVYAKKLGIKEFYFELLPENKVEHIEKLLSSSGDGKVAFVGDGINDAPVIARADVGIAMGALGSDAAVETADVVLMTDSPMQVVKSIEVAVINLNKAAELDTTSPNSVRQLGIIYLQNEKFNEAIESFNLALIRDYLDTESRIGKAIAYWSLKDYDNALAEINEMQSLGLRFNRMELLLADVYFKKKDYDKATKYAKFDEEENSSQAEGHYLLGILYKMNGEKEKAEYELNEAFEISGQDENASLELDTKIFLKKAEDKK